MTTTNSEKRFVFRKKFENLQEKLNFTEEARLAVEESFAKFCSFKEKAALYLLWKMPIDEDYASRALEKLGLTLETIPFAEISTYRNELRYQYEKQNPDFLVHTLQGEIETAYTELVNNSDKVVASTVYTVLRDKLCNESEYLSRILSLLSSEEENRFCGGIHELGFSWKETAYLKSIHLQVHALFNAMLVKKMEADEKYKNKPLKDLGVKLEQAGITLREEKSDKSKTAQKKPASKSIAEQKKEFAKLTAKDVFNHKELFSAFARGSNYNVLSEISSLGFDLNLVMGRIGEIMTLLDAIDAFDK